MPPIEQETLSRANHIAARFPLTVRHRAVKNERESSHHAFSVFFAFSAAVRLAAACPPRRSVHTQRVNQLNLSRACPVPFRGVSCPTRRSTPSYGVSFPNRRPVTFHRRTCYLAGYAVRTFTPGLALRIYLKHTMLSWALRTSAIIILARTLLRPPPRGFAPFTVAVRAASPRSLHSALRRYKGHTPSPECFASLRAISRLPGGCRAPHGIRALSGAPLIPPAATVGEVANVSKIPRMRSCPPH